MMMRRGPLLLALAQQAMLGTGVSSTLGLPFAQREAPAMDHNPEKRAGDTERSQALDRLGQYFADGYLDVHEFDERTGKAALARTQGEIDSLFTDLPAQPPAVLPRQDLQAERELDEVLTRGKKLQRIDAAIWATVMVLFFLGMFVANISFSWVVFPIGAFASWGARAFLNVGDEDEELFEELNKKESEERAERLRQAAERRRELGQ